MKLTWLGHACFLLEEAGYRVVIDPYTDVEGYPPLHVSAHAVYCSHDHFDHHAVDCVTLLPQRESPFTVREIPCFHDDRGGAQRGGNTIRVFMAGGVSVAHLGDLGHRLTARQAADIGKVDALLIPVGGTYTLDAAGAKAVCSAVDTGFVIPMHSRRGGLGFEELAEVEDFLALWPAEEIHRLPGASMEVTAVLQGVWLPEFQE